MWPVVAIAAATALAQMYQSEKARGAEEKRLKQMEAEFKRLVPPNYNLSIMDPPAYIKQAIPEPSFDMAALTPEQFKLVGKYTPEIAPLVLEQRPELIKETAGMKEGRDAQLNALRKLKTAASEGGDPEFGVAMQRAGQSAQIDAQSRQQSILQDMARRGMMGSGAGLAAQLQGSSDAMARAAEQSQNAAVESYRNRLQALRDSASLGGQIRDDETAFQGRNADIINSFNQRTARARQDWANNRAGEINAGSRYNLDREQRVADANVEQNNRYALNERDRGDRLKEYLYGIRRDEQDRQNRIIESEADWRRRERDSRNALEGSAASWRSGNFQGYQGISDRRGDSAMQASQDRNNMYQGLGNSAMSGYMYSSDRDDRRRDQMAADDRAYYEKNGRWMDDEERKKRYGEY